MKTKRWLARFCCLLAVALMSSKLNFGQSEVQHGSFNLPVNKETVVRFFYLPANDYLHPALFFRVVGTNSSRLNTAPITNHGGRTPYISIEEMQALIKLLDSAGLSSLWSAISFCNKRTSSMLCTRVSTSMSSNGLLTKSFAPACNARCLWSGSAVITRT